MDLYFLLTKMFVFFVKVNVIKVVLPVRMETAFNKSTVARCRCYIKLSAGFQDTLLHILQSIPV